MESDCMSEQITEEPENDERVYKLIVNGKTVCCARTLPYSMLLKIETKKEEKRKGYGKKLLGYIEELARKNDAKEMKTDDIDSCSSEAVCFFRSMGYRLEPIKGDEMFLEGKKILDT